jgi:6-phosphogluconolactonase
VAWHLRVVLVVAAIINTWNDGKIRANMASISSGESAAAIIRCKDADALGVQAADLIVGDARRAIHDRGHFIFVLAGGSTPERTYSVLADASHAAGIDWSRTFVFIGDERFVPFDDARSNYGMARRVLLARVPIPSEHLFPIPTTEDSPAEAAEAYANQLARFFSSEVHAAPPRFDLILLGLGEDGHTASLFPGFPSLDIRDRWVTWSPPGALPPPVDRVTLTYPVLNAARHVLFLVAGQKKAIAVRDVLEGGASPQERPAAGVRPVDGQLTWLVDEGAAELLSSHAPPPIGHFNHSTFVTDSR